MLPSYGAEEVEAAISHAVSPGSSQRTIEEFSHAVMVQRPSGLCRVMLLPDGSLSEAVAQ